MVAGFPVGHGRGEETVDVESQVRHAGLLGGGEDILPSGGGEVLHVGGGRGESRSLSCSDPVGAMGIYNL